MPVLRSSKRPRPPATRVYSSAPPLKQKRFPARKRIVKSSPMFTPSGRPSRQETLTQIGFAHVVPDSEDEDMQEVSDLMGEDEEQENRHELPCHGKKRRRIDAGEGRERKKRQSTLTQIGFFTPLEDDEEENEPMHENDCDSRFDAENFQPWATTEKRIRRMTPQHTSFNITSTAGHTPIKQEQCRTPSTHGWSPPLMSPPRPPTPIFKTPQKPIKREVPSSQSPAVTPLTLDNMTPVASPSPLRQQARSPLQIIPENVIAMRDSVTATNGKGCKAKRAASSSPTPKRPAKDVAQVDDMDLDLDLDDQENEDPLVEREEKSPNSKLLQQMDEYSKKLKQTNAPCFTRHAKLQRQPSPLAPASHRSSQATTTDAIHTIPATRHEHNLRKVPQTPLTPIHLTLPSLPSAMEDDSQFPFPLGPSSSSAAPFSIFSDEDDDGVLQEQIVECSPLSSVQDSTEMVPVSQLLGGWTEEAL